MFSSAFTGAKDFIHTPFTEDMDALHLFLLTGLVLVFAILWARILSYFPRSIEV